jgi:hypothetical protein
LRATRGVYEPREPEIGSGGSRVRGKYIVALLLMFAVVSLSVLPAAAQTKSVPGREQQK